MLQTYHSFSAHHNLPVLSTVLSGLCPLSPSLGSARTLEKRGMVLKSGISEFEAVISDEAWANELLS